MADPELASEIEEIRAGSPDSFDRRVRAEADRLVELVDDGAFDNPQAIVGLEYEFYAVAELDEEGQADAADRTPGSLTRVPRRLLEYIRFEKELGLHNAELATSPLPLNADGLAAQEAAVSAQLRTALECVGAEGLRLVSDGMWTIPPEGETAGEYLTDSVLVDGVRIATNMSASPRYHAMANAGTSAQPAMRIDAPHVHLEADTVMPESLITSIQPHYQVPVAVNLPTYFRYALRVAGPLVAMGANSPFFPPDLYDDVAPEDILEDAWAEHRIQVFESVMNAPDADAGKVRFPRDLFTVGDAIDRIAGDDVLVPMPSEETGRFDDEFAAFRQQRGTYWRWVRPVFDGATRSAANARLEFRPLPSQPTVRDTIAFSAAFAGLMESLPAVDHPAIDLDWSTAQENFYAAARSGLEADFRWITGAGTETSDPGAACEDVLAHAAAGLRARGLSDEAVARYLGPLRRRVRYGVTPAGWKRHQVAERVAAGESLDEAIYGMQREYLRRQARTLFDDDFSAWLEEDRYRGG